MLVQRENTRVCRLQSRFQFENTGLLPMRHRFQLENTASIYDFTSENSIIARKIGRDPHTKQTKFTKTDHQTEFFPTIWHDLARLNTIRTSFTGANGENRDPEGRRMAAPGPELRNQNLKTRAHASTVAEASADRARGCQRTSRVQWRSWKMAFKNAAASRMRSSFLHPRPARHPSRRAFKTWPKLIIMSILYFVF